MSKKIPKFKNEDEERDFSGKVDSSEYLDWRNAKSALFPNLDEFDALIQQARKQTKASGLKPKDIKAAIAKVRKRNKD